MSAHHVPQPFVAFTRTWDPCVFIAACVSKRCARCRAYRLLTRAALKYRCVRRHPDQAEAGIFTNRRPPLINLVAEAYANGPLT